jgi:glycosidase
MAVWFSFALLTSVCAQSPRVPSWAKDAVWYQIFPERFRNGDPANDPTGIDMEFPATRAWRVSPWTVDWYKLQPWEERHNRDFYKNVFDRRYGGDLKGVIDKLDYLADLGINAIYFNPIFDAYSLHKYDASTYHHIDKHFGPDPRRDKKLAEDETNDPATWHWSSADSLFLRLIKEAHQRGIRVIIDGVFNHSGTRFWAFRDIQENQQRSRYADWYDIRRWDDTSTSVNEFQWKGWWDNADLPEFKEDSLGFILPVRQYFFNITKRWMDPNADGDPSDGIDGWRLDVANDVSDVFWKEWRIVVKSINPQAYIVGEIWDDARKWLQGDQFDAVMNYRFARACVKFFVNTGNGRLTAKEFDKELSDIRKDYSAETNDVLQNLLDSHDTDRLPSMIQNPNRDYDRNNGLRGNADYNIQMPAPDARKIQRLMVLFQMTYIGAPMLYYGDESGMWGADDPDDRKPMVWPDLSYDNEQTHPFPGRTRSNDRIAFDGDLMGYYRSLVHIRIGHEALRRGSFTTLLADDALAMYAFQRRTPLQSIVVIINNSEARQEATLAAEGTFRDAVSQTQHKSVGGTLKVSLEGKSGLILVKQ